jgi:hypothetical protein
MNEAVGIVGSCINCSTPANLLATFALILFGFGLLARLKRRKLAFSANRDRAS